MREKRKLKESKQFGGKTSILKGLKANEEVVPSSVAISFWCSTSCLHHRRRLVPFVGFCFLARGGGKEKKRKLFPHTTLGAEGGRRGWGGASDKGGKRPNTSAWPPA